MIKKRACRKAVAIGSAVAASLLLTLATSSAASADSMRTLNLSIRCDTGEAYGLLVNGVAPTSGSSYVVGDEKYFTVSIPASATNLSVQPLSCDGEPSGQNGQTALYRPYSVTPGTSTINADTVCHDYSFYGELVFDCPLDSVTYS